MKKLWIFVVLQGFLFGNSCPKWAPIMVDDIMTIIPIYNGNNTKADADCDGVSDVDEKANGTNPNKRDTDGDGTDDYNDDYPLDPHKSKDTTAPVLTLKGSNPLVIYRYIPFKDPGAVAKDDRDGSVAVKKSGSVNTSVPKTYYITYTATDKRGNTSRKKRTVIVKAEVRPQLTLDGSSAADADGDRAANTVAKFIKAYVGGDRNSVEELVGNNERLLSILYNKAEVSTFLKNIYKNTYLIKEHAYALGEVSVSITFIDKGVSHQGGFELMQGRRTDGKRIWIIRNLY